MNSPSPDQAAYISGRAARAKLHVSNYRLLQFVALGRIGDRAEPGTSMRYTAADVERLAAERAARQGADA